MGLISVTSFSDPIENFATEHGKQLFIWAQKTWRGFVMQILDLVEKEDISDQNFTMICDRLARVHSARNLKMHSEMLKEWATLVDLPINDLKAWEAGQKLPPVSKREAIVRQQLERLAMYIRSVNAEVFLSTMVQLVAVKDLRDSATFASVSPKTHRRSIHRLGLPEKVALVLFENNIKTQGDLESFLKPPIPGGLIIHSRKSKPRPPFDPKKKLLKLNGIDEAAADEILKVANAWSSTWPPSHMLV